MLTSVFNKLKFAPNKIRREIVKRNPVLQFVSDFAYETALKRHVEYLPALSKTDHYLVDGLRQEGVSITSLETLSIPSSPLLVDGIKSLLPELQTTSYNNTRYAISLPIAQCMKHPLTILWGLEERLLDIAENYIGLPITYCGPDLRREIANGKPLGARQWHLDVEDHRMVKIIIYLNDVNIKGGAFEYIPKHSTSLLAQRLNYSSGFVSDEVMETIVPISDYKPCLGKFGTAIFVDTCNVFHRIKTPVGSDRYSITFAYTSKRPIKKYYSFNYSKEHLLALTKN